MSDLFDIPLDVNKYFPAHGWTKNKDGMKILFLPIMQLFIGYKSKVFTDNKIGGIWLQSNTPNRSLRNLTICFRELHREVREISPLYDLYHENQGKKVNQGLTRLHEGLEKIEVFLISAFTLLRRLADEIINTSRPLMFEHWRSAPREMKKAIKIAEKDSKKFQLMNPICNIEILNDALVNHTAWFKNLREQNGIRDIIIHKPHIIQLAGCDSEDESINWKVSVKLVRNIGENNNIITVDLFENLISCVDGACKFMELVCKSVGLETVYNERFEYGFVTLTGEDNDIVGLWPPIEGKRSEFPLMK